MNLTTLVPITTPSWHGTMSSNAILQRIKDEGGAFGSGPLSRTAGEVNHLHQGRGFYFECENGHVWEVITHTYITE